MPIRVGTIVLLGVIGEFYSREVRIANFFVFFLYFNMFTLVILNEVFSRSEYQSKLKLMLEKITVTVQQTELANIFAKLPSSVVIVDKEYRVKFMNSKFMEILRVLGLDSESFVEEKIFQTIGENAST